MAFTSTNNCKQVVAAPRTLLTISEAFEKLKGGLHPSDARLFQSTTLEDVRSSAKIIERDQEQRRCLRNLRRIEPLFQAIGKFGIAFDVLCQGTPYLCFIWAPIKLLLQIADEYTKGFDSLIDAYVQIAKHLPRFDRLGSVFSDQEDFQSILADVYADILEFHRHAYKFFRRSGWKHLFDASWRSFNGRFNAILQNLARNQDLVDKEATSFDILEARGCRQRLLKDLEKHEAERREWQLRDTIAWLDLKGQDREQEELFERRSSARESGTCKWILTHPKISLWLDPEDRRLFFWLRGKPGSGKTTLATYLVEEASIPPTAHILYSLCSYGFGRSERNACSLTFRSLIAQLLRKQPELLPYIYDNYVKTGAISSLAKSRELLKNLLESSEQTFLVLDGLDEFEGPDQKQVLTEISNLVNHSSGRDVDQTKLKVLVCSRETKEIAQKMGKNVQISLSNEDRFIQHDIAIFTTNSLSELRGRFEDDVVDAVGADVVQKANGMFLWVRLVLSVILEQESVQDLRSAIRLLPSGLPGVYKLILDRLRKQADDQQQIRAEYILGWLAFACRPLKTWEVCSGVVFHHEDGSLNDQSKLGKGILNICKPLIEEREGEDIALVHFSAREFLLHRSSGPYLSPSVAHANITMACVRYLLTCKEFTNASLSPATYGHIVKGFHDIFNYVQEFWPEHLGKFIDSVKDIEDDGILRAVLDRLCLIATTFGRTPASQRRFGNVLDYQASSIPTIATTEPAVMKEIPELVQKYIDFRKDTAISRLPASTESVHVNFESDPTILTETYSYFRTAFESLVNDPPQFSYAEMGITVTDLVKFIERHRTNAYCCRWSGCIWASAGFGTSEERVNHENSHKQQFRCQDPSCDFGRYGFASRGALRIHTRKYHTRDEDLVLPEFPQWRNKSDQVAGGTTNSSSRDPILQNLHTVLEWEEKSAATKLDGSIPDDISFDEADPELPPAIPVMSAPTSELSKAAFNAALANAVDIARMKADAKHRDRNFPVENDTLALADDTSAKDQDTVVKTIVTTNITKDLATSAEDREVLIEEGVGSITARPERPEFEWTYQTNEGQENVNAAMENTQEKPVAIDDWRSKVRTIITERLVTTAEELEALMEEGEGFLTAMPELPELERVHQSTKWQEDVDTAKENFQDKTPDECRELLARATKLNVSTLHPDVMRLNDMCRQGDIWEQRANKVMSAGDAYYPELESLHARWQEFKFPVKKETLAKMDIMLVKNREAKIRIITLVNRSHDPNFRQRPMYIEARDVMKTVEDLNGKPHGTAALEKELKRHEDWIRKGKKLFGKGNSPLHILKQHMRIVTDKNNACFDLKDTFRLPVEPSSRHASPAEGNEEFGDLGDYEKPSFCICRSPEAGLMIECEICHEWYHAKCLRITRSKVEEFETFTCPICDWRVKIPRDNARPKLDDLHQWQEELPDLPFQPEEEELLNAIINKAQAFRDFLTQYINDNQLCRTSEEMPEMLFYLRKIEGAEVLLSYETNIFRQELHKWRPIAPYPPPIIDTSLSTRKPRPTKQQKLMKELGVEKPEDLPPHLRTKQYVRRKPTDSFVTASSGRDPAT